MVKENNLTSSSSPYVLTKFDLLVNVGQESPRAAELLADYGLHCINCFFSEYDTLESGANMHGMSIEEVDDMIGEVNIQLEKEWKENRSKIKNKTQNAKVPSSFTPIKPGGDFGRAGKTARQSKTTRKNLKI